MRGENKFQRKWRQFLFRGVRPRMMRKIKDNNGRVIHKTRISTSTFIDTPDRLSLETNIYIGHHNFIDASNDIMIGEGCQITNFISILSHSSHNAIRVYGAEYTNVKDKKVYTKGAVEIGKYSFIGPHSTIMPGTKIGKGCIVSAYSYVDGEYPDFSIIAGNPASVVGDTRNGDSKLLEEFQELKEFYNDWAK